MQWAKITDGGRCSAWNLQSRTREIEEGKGARVGYGSGRAGAIREEDAGSTEDGVATNGEGREGLAR